MTDSPAQPKACPFCGQPPEVARVNFNTKVKIMCRMSDACPILVQTPTLPYGKALKVWNQRPVKVPNCYALGTDNAGHAMGIVSQVPTDMPLYTE